MPNQCECPPCAPVRVGARKLLRARVTSGAGGNLRPVGRGVLGKMLRDGPPDRLICGARPSSAPLSVRLRVDHRRAQDELVHESMSPGISLSARLAVSASHAAAPALCALRGRDYAFSKGARAASPSSFQDLSRAGRRASLGDGTGTPPGERQYTTLPGACQRATTWRGLRVRRTRSALGAEDPWGTW